MKINHGDRNKEISGTLVDLIDLTASATNLGGYFTLGAKGLVNPLLSRLYNPIKNNVRTTYNVGKSLYNAAKQTAKKTTTSLAKPNVVSEIGVPLQKINLDKLYFDAIEKGDIAEAQRLRDLHFISKARNPITEYNKPTHLYHGTRSEPFYIFDNSKGFQSVGSWLTKEPSKAIFTVPSYSEAKLYTGKHGHVIDLYGNSKPEIIDWGGNDWTIGDFGTSTETANVYLNHYPSLKYKNIRDASNIAVDEYIFNQNNNDLKLADPITYDNAGNIIPLSKRDNFKVNDIRYGWFGKQPNGTFVEDYTDFNTMVQRMNNKVQYDGVNPFTDGKMTGFRKWALNNGASPKKIIEVEKKYSKNNWEKLKQFKIDDYYTSYSPEDNTIYVNKNEPEFNQVFSHEVEHKLFYLLFNENRNSITINEINKAFKSNDKFWSMPGNRNDFYFIGNDFEELLTRFTQIKNALGIKEQRALTENELRRSYNMFKNGDPRIANNNMKEFFESIKDWKEAAKLSGKALSLSLILDTNQINEE